MTDFKIRPIIARDIPDIVTMIHELTAFHNDTSAATIASVTRDTTGPAPWWHVYVAEADNALIGYMILLPKSKIADGTRGIDINHMYVRENHRGTGVGRTFIAAAKRHARQNACSYVMIGTAPDNTAAQAAYLACGFDSLPDPGGPRFRMQL